ncbi:MAG: tol-pal system protein YbgF [Desulfovibrio sp.]|jgi:tol-pal system protein YbgF|nr:tol-pal system protein YbgF [Desulfovibrio sp.]
MKTRRFFLGSALLGMAFILNACFQSSSAVESRDLEQQVRQQNAQLQQLQPAQADMQNEVQALRAEISHLRGQIDDLQSAGGARALMERVNRQDAALRQIDDRMALNLDLDQPGQPAQPVQPDGQEADSAGIALTGVSSGLAAAPHDARNSLPTYGDPALPGPSSSGAAAPEGTLPYQGGAAQQTRQTAQGPGADGTWGQPSPRPAPPPQAPKKDVSLALFDSGVNAYNARNYTEAQRSFNDFLKNYPSHNLIPEAQFYLAECQFQRNQFADAALAYDVVIKKHPSSSSAPGAYLKQGICFSKLNQKAAATARMQELVKKYPKSPEAARAKTFLKTNK